MRTPEFEPQGSAGTRNPTESPTMDVFESCGEKCANLRRVYKLIMVSCVPGYGHFEYLEVDIYDDLITL